MAEVNVDIVDLTAYLGVLAVLPLIVVSLTAYLKSAVVLFLTRDALGIAQTPPNLVLYGLAFALTIYVTAPLIGSIAERFSTHPTDFNSPQSIDNALGLLREPVQDYLIRFSEPEERQFFLTATQQIWPASARAGLKSEDLIVMLPAFISSELTRGFEIGLLLYLPFLVIDLMVVAALTVLGRPMVQPTLISVPLKLALFVAVAGWSRLLHGMVLNHG